MTFFLCEMFASAIYRYIFGSLPSIECFYFLFSLISGQISQINTVCDHFCTCAYIINLLFRTSASIFEVDWMWIQAIIHKSVILIQI